MAMIATENQASVFLNALFGGIDKGFLTISEFKDRKTKWFGINEKEAAVHYSMELAKSRDVYFGLGSRKEQLTEHERGKSKDVSFLPCAWLEIDLKGGKHSKDNLPSQQEAEMILNSFSLEPSIIVHSGGGLHCYWLFDEAFRVLTDSEKASADRMLKRFQSMFIRLAKTKSLHIDNTSDLARVLRVPGTYNHKEQPKPVKVLKMTDTRYSLIELKEAIEKLETKTPKNQIEHKKRTEPSDAELPDANFEPIKNECLFLKSYMDHKETASYSEWVAAGSIVSYCKDGLEIFNEISKGYPTYNEQEIERKYNEIRSKMKPRTCSSLNQEFGECAGCKHFNKINSPIAIGMRNADNFQINIESDIFESQQKADWRRKLEYGKTKKGGEYLLPNARNIELILENCIADKLAYDEFLQTEVVKENLPWRKAKVSEEWGNADISQLLHWFDTKWDVVGKDRILNAFIHVIQKRSFHPIKEYLESTVWDGELRIPYLFHNFLGTEDNSFNCEISIRWFVGAIKRIYQPGCKHDWGIVLVGPKGIGKSWLIQKITPSNYFGELTNFDAKIGGELLRGKWILEIPELSARKKSNNEEIKAFMSRQSDDYRAAYARKTEMRPRQCVFIGTTNKMEFITDETGDRRNVPLVCRKEQITMNVSDDLTPEYIAQLWAEAKFYFDEGKESYLDKQLSDELDEINEIHRLTDPLQDEVLTYAESIHQSGRNHLCVREIWDNVVTDDMKKKPTKKDSERITNILTSLGYERTAKKQRCGEYGPRDAYIKK